MPLRRKEKKTRGDVKNKKIKTFPFEIIFKCMREHREIIYREKFLRALMLKERRKKGIIIIIVVDEKKEGKCSLK